MTQIWAVCPVGSLSEIIAMAELSLTVVPAKVLSDGTHTIRIYINHKNETRYIITRFRIDNICQFKNGRVVNNTDASMINRKLSSLVNDYYDKIDNINCNPLRALNLKTILKPLNAQSRLN